MSNHSILKIFILAVIYLITNQSICRAQDFPNRPIRLIIPTSPGGTSDIIGRVLAQRMGDSFGQQVIADNRAGASNTIGIGLVAKAVPDGYTIGISSASLAINPSIIRQMPYDTLTEIAPISRLSEGPFMILSHPSLPVKNVQGLIDIARKNPRLVVIGSSGIGTTPHLAGELFNIMTGTKILQVVFKGTGQSLVSLLSGEISLTYASPIAVSQYVKAGKLRALAVTSKKRSPTFPEVPAVGESVAGYEAIQWFGLMTTAGTPKPVIDKLNNVTVAILRTTDLTQRFASEGMEVVASSPLEFATTLKLEMAKWGGVVKAAGIKEE